MAAEETKRRILDAAFEEFAEHGLSGARVDRISSKAGCNKNLIYVYFDKKETLFATVLESCLTDVYENIPFTPEDLPGFARCVFDYSEANPGVYRLLAWATLENPLVLPTMRQEKFDANAKLIHARQLSGAIKLDLPPELIMTAVMCLATGWSPAFPFGVIANPTANLSANEIRDAVATMVERITEQG